MQSRENIQKLNDHLQAFPKAEDIFTKDQQWLKKHFLPLMSIDLAEINPDWAGQKVYMLCPFEANIGYMGGNTTEYHNEYTAPNWVTFKLTDDNKFEFLGNEGFFERTKYHNWDFDSKEEKELQEMVESYEQSKKNIIKYGTLVDTNYPEYQGKPNRVNYLNNLGGDIWSGNWQGSIDDGEYPKAFDMQLEYERQPSPDWIKISYQGNPFYFIADTASYDWCKGHIDGIIMLYEPVSRIVLFTFDYS